LFGFVLFCFVWFGLVWFGVDVGVRGIEKDEIPAKLKGESENGRISTSKSLAESDLSHVACRMSHVACCMFHVEICLCYVNDYVCACVNFA
jgi:hypothetical protein